MRAAAGVACLIHKDLKHAIQQWKGWSERILTLHLNESNIDEMTIIAIYGSNEDHTMGNGDKFWKELSGITESSEGKVILAGDFNERVGIKDIISKDVIGS